jgi:hypothetical protein
VELTKLQLKNVSYSKFKQVLTLFNRAYSIVGPAFVATHTVLLAFLAGRMLPPQACPLVVFMQTYLPTDSGFGSDVLGISCILIGSGMDKIATKNIGYSKFKQMLTFFVDTRSKIALAAVATHLVVLAVLVGFDFASASLSTCKFHATLLTHEVWL